MNISSSTLSYSPQKTNYTPSNLIRQHNRKDQLIRAETSANTTASIGQHDYMYRLFGRDRTSYTYRGRRLGYTTKDGELPRPPIVMFLPLAFQWRRGSAQKGVPQKAMGKKYCLFFMQKSAIQPLKFC